MTDTQTSNSTIPTTLPDLDPDVIRKAASYATIRTDVAMRFQVQSVERKTYDSSGSLYLQCGVKPLNEHNKPVSPGTVLKLIMPQPNPSAVGKKYENVGPNTLSQWHSVLNALNPEKFPRFPKKTGNVWETEAGETLRTSQENEAYRNKIMKDVSAYSKRCWENTETLLKEVFVSQPRATKGDDGRVFIDIDPYKVYSLDDTSQLDVPVVSEKFSA